MKKIRLLLEYDGSAYQGWQSQRSGLTIQDILEEHLRKITGEQQRIIGAGRTDAGVHAFGQVAAFSTATAHPPEIFRRALNATLPKDIRVLDAFEAEEHFHPRYDAQAKSYVYLIGLHLTSAFLYRYCWGLHSTLDVAAMADAARAFVGTHDFSTFRGTGCSAKSPIRTVTSIEVTRLSALEFMTATIQGEFVSVRIEGNGFLRHMVRTIVGTLAEIGAGKFPSSQAAELLQARNRAAAGPTAPAQGLFLEKVMY